MSFGKFLGKVGGAIGGGFGGIGGALIGGLFGAKGQSKANEQNLAIARENRAWQEKMSNTAYQRAATDLDKAGLNRILALGSPATTPGGNVATMGNVGAAGVTGAVEGQSSALATKRLAQELKNLRWQQFETESRIGLQAAQKAKTLYEANSAEHTSKILKRELELSGIDRKIYDKAPWLRVLEKITGSVPIKRR